MKFVSLIVFAATLLFASSAFAQEASPAGQYAAESVSVLAAGAVTSVGNNNTVAGTGALALREVWQGFAFGQSVAVTAATGTTTTTGLSGSLGFALELAPNVAVTPSVSAGALVQNSTALFVPGGEVALELFPYHHVMFEPYVAGGALVNTNTNVQTGVFQTGWRVGLVF